LTSKMGKTITRGGIRDAPITDGGVFCPLCGTRFSPSEYLCTVFQNPKINWLAQMVCHYRHNHIEYYDNGVGFQASIGQHEVFKHLVNERIKRQIIRKCQAYMKRLGLKARDLKELQGTTEETLALAGQLLEGVKRVRVRKALRIRVRPIRAQTRLEDFTCPT